VLVVDTGPLLATADRSDRDQAACRELLEGDEGPLVTTAMVIAEPAYLIDRQLGPAAEASLYAAIAAGQIEVAGPVAGDWQRIGELVTTYASEHAAGRDRCLGRRAGGAAGRDPDRDPGPAALRGCAAPSHRRIYPPARLTYGRPPSPRGRYEPSRILQSGEQLRSIYESGEIVRDIVLGLPPADEQEVKQAWQQISETVLQHRHLIRSTCGPGRSVRSMRTKSKRLDQRFRERALQLSNEG
jgi:hypothetical protein